MDAVFDEKFLSITIISSTLHERDSSFSDFVFVPADNAHEVGHTGQHDFILEVASHEVGHVCQNMLFRRMLVTMIGFMWLNMR